MKAINKIKWVSGIVLIFCIVLATNLIDRDNFNKLKETTRTIYEDRIVASDIIYEISHIYQEKKLALATSDSSYFITKNKAFTDQVEVLVDKYDHTKLTDKEAKIFNTLKTEFKEFSAADLSLSSKEEKERLIALISAIDENMYDLAKVQLEEGKRQMITSNDTMESINLFTQIEIIFLVIAGIAIQVIILYKPLKG